MDLSGRLTIARMRLSAAPNSSSGEYPRAAGGLESRIHVRRHDPFFVVPREKVHDPSDGPSVHIPCPVADQLCCSRVCSVAHGLLVRIRGACRSMRRRAKEDRSMGRRSKTNREPHTVRPDLPDSGRDARDRLKADRDAEHADRSASVERPGESGSEIHGAPVRNWSKPSEDTPEGNEERPA